MLQNAQVFARTHPGPVADKTLAYYTPEPVPVCAVHAAQAFDVLASTRGEGLSGPKALTLHDVHAYSTTICRLTARDARWVLAQDAAFLAEVAHG